MSEHDVRDVTSNGKAAKPILELTYRSVPNPHAMQFYVDFGVSNTGPWAVVGFNDTEYAVGYQPRKYASRPAERRENPHKRTSENVINAIVKTLS